ncbi:MAG: protocatechuate 3,4-dioxygenase subunit beta [Betaproteobacteria bacterium]|nr:protocatechuate 3,4-dioxygenase subunit beta [Betaproteobacteria bacterium]MDH4325632.1 protocatechuate 3,4-dioxygenase subunit beta [Betaproteobacteria bacterium]MDH5210047.1 protocatechuate 3,4-dioxygenase subunit beta [Betaproteobacteria bacterium]MDH5577339.1 protocatechuate 3,4-dioxygenase subunit beta [Betaproteobacteria bacterium]
MQVTIMPRDERTQPLRIVPGYPQTPPRNPKAPLVQRAPTLSELTGPVDVARRVQLLGGDIAGHGEKQAIGQLMQLRLRVVDEDGAPVGGTVVEIWQANGAGRYIHPNDDDHAPVDANFYGAARLATDDTGALELRTVKPGAYPVPTNDGWWRPPHIHFSIFGKVWLQRLVTQMYFPGEPLNGQDRILNAVPDAQARECLVARLVPPTGEPHNALVFEHRIVLRGRRATPAQP